MVLVVVEVVVVVVVVVEDEVVVEVVEESTTVNVPLPVNVWTVSEPSVLMLPPVHSPNSVVV